LNDFPIDLQEISIIVASQLSSEQIRMEADPNNWSHLRANATNVFTDQQKWFVNLFLIMDE
jgi:hypothetical protein